MLKIALLAFLMFLVCPKQQRADDDKRVIIPRDILPAVIVYQPDCPLKIEFAQLQRSTDGGGSLGKIRYRNIGNRAILAYEVGYLMPSGTGEAWGGKGPILEGETIPESDPPNFGNIVPLTSNLRQKLGLTDDLLGVWMIMVVKVEFSDGTLYSDEKLYSNLKEYLSKALDK